MIKLKYGEMDSWVTKEANIPYGVTVWRSIRNWWHILLKHTTIIVNDGWRTSFWKDKWLGDRNLATEFPDLFNIALHQEKTLEDMWSLQCWNLVFRRKLNDWEIPRVGELLKILDCFQGPKDGMDRLWWRGHSKGSYKVNSGYKLLNLVGA